MVPTLFFLTSLTRCTVALLSKRHNQSERVATRRRNDCGSAVIVEGHGIDHMHLGFQLQLAPRWTMVSLLRDALAMVCVYASRHGNGSTMGSASSHHGRIV